MRLSGRRLTLLLTTLLAVVIGVGVTAAWTVGRHRGEVPAAVADYRAGPVDDQSVRLSASAGGHPRASEVLTTVQHYFDAINSRNYGAWTQAVASAQSAPQTEAQWTRDYSTTTDSNLTVVGISDDPLRVRMMFTSEQDVEMAPKSLPVACINWDVTYLLGEQDGRLVLTGIDPSAQSMTACA
jgi:hypothetical protein